MSEVSKLRDAVLESAQAHAEAQETVEIQVPEWPVNGEPLIIYSSPVTLGQRRKLQLKNKDDVVGQNVDLVIMKARDADGDRIFKPIDRKLILDKLTGEVIGRIAQEIVGEPLEDEETGERLDPAERARKNLKTIPSSSR